MAIFTPKKEQTFVTINVRLEEGLAAELKVYAASLNRSVSELVSMAVQHAIEREKKERGNVQTVKRVRKARAVGGD